MYWPLGIPKYYAASGNRNEERETPESDERAGSAEILAEGTNPGDGGERVNAKGEESVTREGRSSLLENIVDIGTCRNGHIFATITGSSLSIWQTKPTALLATVMRSKSSLESYGANVALLVRSDAAIVVVQTSNGFLITYSLASDPNSRVYQPQMTNAGGSHVRKQSTEDYRKTAPLPPYGPSDGGGIRDINVRFRMVIRIDAGISCALASDDEIIVATAKPSALQCIHWSPDKRASSHSTELLKHLPWVAEKTTLIDMVFDRPMSLHVWVGSDGKAYAAQRTMRTGSDEGGAVSLFDGHCFYEPDHEGARAIIAAINARFSLVTLGCADSTLRVFTAKDYLGNVPWSKTLRLPVSISSSGALTFLRYSQDGYALFAGFEKGWAIWSVYGKLGANSFSVDQQTAIANNQLWLSGMANGFWAGGGSEMILLSSSRDRLCSVEMARSSITACFAMPNIFRSLLQTSTSLMLYRGIGVLDLTALSPDTPLWQTMQLPALYLANQWPVKCSVVSRDGRYVAAAGRRGLVHYSLTSGRWKTFEDPFAESEFTIRGGMCWYQHILLAAVETEGLYQVRLYSREKPLDSSSMIQVEGFSFPIIHMALSGPDSLLVYTHENILFHYTFVTNRSTVKISLVGQIAFHGIIRAPARVRSISWILPDEQRETGDPSQDVATAAVLFLIDGKLVLLQPSAGESGELKYDMRVVAQDVEHYALTREQDDREADNLEDTTPDWRSSAMTDDLGHSLKDSLWFFDGKSMRIWADVMDVVASAPADLGRELPPTVSIPTDFYPLTAMIGRGVLTGLESEIMQRRDVDFAYGRFQSRTHLFIPPLLRHYLSHFDSPAALHLSDSYQSLPYFAHALEVLLHHVLDDEVELSPAEGDTSLLANVLYFLSSFTSYLDIIVGCARKTELRSWHTLFQHLPPVAELFEESLQQDKLKTAGGFLLVLHAFDETSFNMQQSARLLQAAKEAGDFELCKELARFLVGIDESGQMLRTAIANADLDRDGVDTSAKRDNGSSYLDKRHGERSKDEVDHEVDDLHGFGHSDGHKSATNGSKAEDDYFSVGR